MKLIIGNKAYSSWSLRGWLAVKQSGLPFEEVVLSMFGPEWDARKTRSDIGVSGGKVPTLWNGDIAVWDSLAIVETLNDMTGNGRFWPQNKAACAFARSISAEMHSSYMPLRKACPMNVRRIFPAQTPSDAVLADLERITSLWEQTRYRFGKPGPYLFGEFGAADIMFAPVVFRIQGYELPISSEVSRNYVKTMLAHPWMMEWVEDAKAESWVIDKYEVGPDYS